MEDKEKNKAVHEEKHEKKEEEKVKIEKEEETKKDKKDIDALMEKLKKCDNDELIKIYIKSLKDKDKTKKALDEKEKEVQELLDKYRRSLAEMENLRKRMIIEKQDSLKYANFNIISDLLIILDDFERAIISAKNDEKTELSHFVEGIDMIEKQLADLLFKKYGVVKYCEPNEEFDPKIHLAMTLEEGEFENEMVLEVYRKGYKLHDRVIRAAEVKVGKPKEKTKDN